MFTIKIIFSGIDLATFVMNTSKYIDSLFSLFFKEPAKIFPGGSSSLYYTFYFMFLIILIIKLNEFNQFDWELSAQLLFIIIIFVLIEISTGPDAWVIPFRTFAGIIVTPKPSPYDGNRSYDTGRYF